MGSLARISRFNARAMVLEIVHFEGQTPPDPDEMGGLKPKHITTQAELNAFELQNIVSGQRCSIKFRPKHSRQMNWLCDSTASLFGFIRSRTEMAGTPASWRISSCSDWAVSGSLGAPPTWQKEMPDRCTWGRFEPPTREITVRCWRSLAHS